MWPRKKICSDGKSPLFHGKGRKKYSWEKKEKEISIKYEGLGKREKKSVEFENIL